MLCGSETWCMRESEMMALRRTGKAMIKAMYGVKFLRK